MRSIRTLSAGIAAGLLIAVLALTPSLADAPAARPGAIVPSTVRALTSDAAPLPKPVPEAGSIRASEIDHLRKQIGQMILVGFVGNAVDHRGYERVASQSQAGEITGVLYLGRNIQNRTAVRRMNAGLRDVSPPHLPPLIAIDQEGGVVQRLERWHRFPQTVSAKQMARRATPSEAATAYSVLAEGLADWGFNLNLGPVVDLDTNPRNPIIGRLGRSYSSDPETVVSYGTAFIEAHRRHGVFTTLKHFPGHGSSRTDSHRGAVDISRTWRPVELEPYRQLIAQDQVDLIMTAHVHNRRLQGKDENVPVSLSQSALSGTLRGELGYSGVIVSDDLQMDAIRLNYTFRDAVVNAVKAGTDILVFANDKRPDPEVPAKVADILTKAAESDPDLRLKIDAAYKRILALKSQQNTLPVPKPSLPQALPSVAKTKTDSSKNVLTPEEVDASIRSVRLVLPEDLAL